MSLRAASLCVLLFASTATAEPLSLSDALVRAEEVSAAVQLQQLSSESAEAQYLSDPRAGAPSVRIGLRDLDIRTDTNPDPSPVEVVTRLRFPFPRPWDLSAAATLGKATVAREEAELEGIREGLRVAVIRRFHAVPLMRQGVEWAQQLTALRAQHLQLVAELRGEGLATALDWLESEEERRDADDARATRAARLESTEAELRLLLSWPVNEPLELVAAPTEDRAEMPLPTIENLNEGLAGRDPDVREAEAEIRRSEARLRRLQLSALPWLDWAQGGAVFKRDTPVSFEVGVAIDVPIYMWSAARTRAASQDISAAKLQLTDARASAEQELARRLREAAAAKERWAVEKEHLDAVIEHVTPLLDVADPLLKLELQSRLARANLRVLSALIDLIDDLDRLNGEAHR